MELERRTVPEQKLFYSPDSLLARFFLEPDCPSRLILITGNSGAGKTAWCRALIERALAVGITPSGLLSPAVFESGEKIAIDLIDLPQNTRMRLAIRPDHQPAGFHFKGSLNWMFNDQALAWGNEILQRLDKTDLLILDELGPLELLENDGLTKALKLVDDRQYCLACVVVRPSLLATALERWPWGEVLDISTHASRKIKAPS